MTAFRTALLPPIFSAITLLLAFPLLAQTAMTDLLGSDRIEVVPSIRIAVRPGVESPVLMNAAPNATCFLHAQDDSGRKMMLLADGEGQVRFYINAHREFSEAPRLELDCTTADSKQITYPAEVSASAVAPEPSVDARTEKLPEAARMTEPLAADDARSLSSTELAKLGFPPRPDEASSPGNFTKWLNIVTRPHIQVQASQIARTDIPRPQSGVTNGTESHATWSGYELRGRAGTYNAVMGSWSVPSVSCKPTSGSLCFNALFVGLDGDGTADLLQAGTEQEAFTYHNYTLTDYYFFNEVMPNQGLGQEIGHFPVAPSDTVFSEVWVGDSFGNPNNNGGYEWIFLLNEKTNQMYETSVPLKGTKFLGKEAEWILERPTETNGTPYMLASYGLAVINEATALSETGVATNYSASNDINLLMVNDYKVYHDNNPLSVAMYLDPTSMVFFWLNFH